MNNLSKIVVALERLVDARKRGTADYFKEMARFDVLLYDLYVGALQTATYVRQLEDDGYAMMELHHEHGQAIEQ